MKSDNKSYERFMFDQIKAIFAAYFSHMATLRFPYFNQSLKFLQTFTVFNILRYQDPYIRSYKSDRLEVT